MSQPIIQIQDVTMRFRMSNDRIMSLKEFVTTALRGKLKYKEFEALKHGKSRRNCGDYREKWFWQEHNIENYIWNYETYRGQCFG